MATKSQSIQAQQKHDARPVKPKRPVRRRRDTLVDTAKPGVSATDRKAGGGVAGTRNTSTKAQKKGGARLETSATGKASRKSTRKSAGRIKRTSNLQRKAIRKTTASRKNPEGAKTRKR